MNEEAGYQGAVKGSSDGIGDGLFLHGKILKMLDCVGEPVDSDDKTKGKHYIDNDFEIESTPICDDNIHIDYRLTIKYKGELKFDGSRYGDRDLKKGPWQKKLCSFAQEVF